MKAIHVVAGLDPRHGGPTYSVPRLCRALRENGVEAELLSVDTSGPGTAGPAATAELFPWNLSTVPIAKHLRASAPLAKELRKRAGMADVIHNHGLWLMPNVYAGRAAARARRPLIVTPRGMLSPEALRFSRSRKELFWRALQKDAFRAAACYHATSEAEHEDIRRFGITAPVAIIPNGVDTAQRTDTPVSRETSVLYIGRLHPMKNLFGLLRAWALVEPVAEGWKLRIVGPDEEGHLEQLKALISELNLRTVSLEPPVFGEEKARLYGRAGLMILPSHGENFGMTVAEALSAGMPVIASRGTPWSGLVQERCGWWVDNDPVSLARAIAEGLALPTHELDAMGERGRRWVERAFGWSSIAARMTEVYGWVTGRCDRPSRVRLD